MKTFTSESASKAEKTQSGGLFTGAAVSLMGLASVAVTLTADAELLSENYAPRSVGICAGSLFVLFGLSILQQSFIARGWIKQPLIPAPLFVALVFTLFGIVLSWSVFGGNARSYISVPLVGDVPFAAGDSIGRFIILLVAIPIDCLAVLCWVLVLGRFRKK